MRLEIINTGDELLLGTTLNTHGAWLGTELLKIGLRAARQVTVPDGKAIGEELRNRLAECDVVIVTGGLGPTSDDLTREETAKALNLELIEDEFAARTIRKFFTDRGREMAECNLKQALSPCGADILPNSNGTAPGIYVPPRLGSSAAAVFLLPGPPSELRPMFLDEVVPRLQALTSEAHESSGMDVLSFIDVGESDFHQVLDVELNAIEGLEVGYCARPSDVDLRLIGSEAVREQAKVLVLEKFAAQCYSETGESMEQAVVRLLTEKGLRVATAESCTGGRIASRLTDVAGSSAVLEYGYVTYANRAKVDLLGVEVGLLEVKGAVSEEVALAMADGALQRSGADIAVSVTGIAGPGGGSDDKPVGTVWVGVAVKGKPTTAYREVHARGRESFKLVVSQRVLGQIRQQVLNF